MIIGGMCVSAKADLLRGMHNEKDVFKLALYSEQATLNSSVREYTTTNECTGKGYTRGGIVLSGLVIAEDGGRGVMGWTVDPLWRNATISSPGGLIYNASKGNRALVVVEFGELIRSTNGNFRVPMPPVTAEEALIYLA